MPIEPKLEMRPERPYVGIRKRVGMQELGTVLPPLAGDVLAWLAKKGLQPSGPPFWRYLIVDMDEGLEIDVGVPLAKPVSGAGGFIADSLPSGRYATILHTGHPDELERVTAGLLEWAERKGIGWKMDGERWAARVEWYLSDPAVEPDMHKWKTELAFLTE